jgi:uncharacterized protein DUF5687
MILTLLSHQWKSFWRSSSAGKSLATQLFIGFLMLYLLVSAAILGISLKYFLQQLFPGQDIVRVFCGLILYYFSMDILMRFTFQELPVLAIQPYLTENIRRRQLAGFLNIRSLFHFFNLLPLLIFTPFTVNTIARMYGAVPAIGFMISILSLIAFGHFLILYVKRKTIINAWWLVGFLLIVCSCAALDYFHIFSFRTVSATLFVRLLSAPWLCGIPVIMGLSAYFNNNNFLKKNLYLEEIIRSGKAKQSTDYTWLHQLGLTGELISLDIKLILRNKRPRNVAMSCCFMLLYGLVLYNKHIGNHSVLPMILLGALLITGIFIINYGQFLFAWQSGHFDLLMSSNIPIQSYLRAKLSLFIFVSTITFIIATLYGFLDWRIIPVQLAACLYNIGVNSIVATYFATRSYKGIDLSKSAAFNYKGMGSSQWLYALAVLVLPLLIYWPLAKFVSPWTAIAVIGSIGLISLLLQRWWIEFLTREFLKRKHLILQGFREK